MNAGVRRGQGGRAAGARQGPLACAATAIVMAAVFWISLIWAAERLFG